MIIIVNLTRDKKALSAFKAWWTLQFMIFRIFNSKIASQKLAITFPKLKKTCLKILCETKNGWNVWGFMLFKRGEYGKQLCVPLIGTKCYHVTSYLVLFRELWTQSKNLWISTLCFSFENGIKTRN